MTVAYVDTSYLAAIALGERTAPRLTRRLAAFDELVASTLLEAELRSALQRESLPFDEALTARVGWILPDRSLGPEIRRVLETGYVRGADCLHLASALYVAPEPGTATFLTLDARQRTVARALGFRVR